MVAGGGRGETGLGTDHRDHRHTIRERAPERRQCGGRGGVARDDQELGALVDEPCSELERKGLELGLRAVAVGEPRRVAQVDVVLVRQRHQALVEHGESADAGIEDGNWERTTGLAHAAMLAEPPAATGPRTRTAPS